MLSFKYPIAPVCLNCKHHQEACQNRANHIQESHWRIMRCCTSYQDSFTERGHLAHQTLLIFLVFTLSSRTRRRVAVVAAVVPLCGYTGSTHTGKIRWLARGKYVGWHRENTDVGKTGHLHNRSLEYLHRWWKQKPFSKIPILGLHVQRESWQSS